MAAYPYLTEGDYDLGVRAMQVAVARALKHAGKPTQNAQNGAWGYWTTRDLVLFKQNRNLRDTRGKINPHVFGLQAWQAAAPFLQDREKAWIAKRMQQLAAERAAARASKDADRLRQAIRAVAIRFWENRHRYTYAQIRPFPPDLFGVAARTRLDCSSSSILIYKAAGVTPDPSGFSYQGWGDTGALWRRGRRGDQLRVGDMAFYGWESWLSRPGHVTVYIGDGEVISFGSTPPSRRALRYRSDYIGCRSYL